jgi:predicted enzyme related to lactoylglutathione lyase
VAAQLEALCVDAHDPGRVAAFWAGLLGWQQVEPGRPGVGAELVPTDDTGFRLRLLPSAEPRLVQNRMHFDLTSTSLQDQQRTVARVLELGGRHVDVGQTEQDDHVVLADPEGNELCVIEPGNRFLADCGRVGALACEGSQSVGYFWAAALGWPLVWDQGEETAVRSPHGGPKLTWGGRPFRPRTGRDRLHLDLVPGPEEDQRSALDRLLALGATRSGSGPGREGASGAGRLELADPDGNAFCLLDRPG